METKGPAPRSLLAAEAFRPVLDAYVQINQLKQLYRQGWLRRGVPRTHIRVRNSVQSLRLSLC